MGCLRCAWPVGLLFVALAALLVGARPQGSPHDPDEDWFLAGTSVPEVRMPKWDDEGTERGYHGNRDVDLWQIISNFPFPMLMDTKLVDDEGDNDDDDFEEYYEEYYDDDEDDEEYDDEYDDEDYDDYDLYDDDDEDDEDADASPEDGGKYLKGETENESDEDFLDSEDMEERGEMHDGDEVIVVISHEGRAGDFELSVPALIAKK